MLDGGKQPEYTLRTCLFEHEEGFNESSIALTIDKAKKCIARNFGLNLLCAHTDQFPGQEGEYNGHEMLLAQLENTGNLIAIKKTKTVKAINRALDNLVRSSYLDHIWTGGSVSGLDDLDTNLWEKCRGDITDIKQLLEATIGKKMPFNRGHRNRLNYLVRKIKDICRGEMEKIVALI